MIPENKRRTIVINDIEYEYAITNHYSKNIFIKNLTTNHTCKKYYDYECSITPSDIRQIILDEGV
jgi:hypothetical protein